MSEKDSQGVCEEYLSFVSFSYYLKISIAGVKYYEPVLHELSGGISVKKPAAKAKRYTRTGFDPWLV